MDRASNAPSSHALVVPAGGFLDAATLEWIVAESGLRAQEAVDTYFAKKRKYNYKYKDDGLALRDWARNGGGLLRWLDGSQTGGKPASISGGPSLILRAEANPEKTREELETLTREIIGEDVKGFLKAMNLGQLPKS